MTRKTYLASLPADARRELRKLREAIRAAVPGASDGFSYGMPFISLDGRPIIGYAAWKEHVSIFASARPSSAPMPPRSKGTKPRRARFAFRAPNRFRRPW